MKVTTLTAISMIALLTACATMPEKTSHFAVEPGSPEAEAQSLGLGTNATGQNTTGAVIVEPNAAAFDNNPQGSIATKVSSGPSISRQQFLDATSIIGDAAIILTKLF